MALSIFHLDDNLVIVAGYENGLAIAASLHLSGDWNILYHSTPHSQPILSLDVAATKDYFLTSSADAIIAKHPIPRAEASSNSAKVKPSIQKGDAQTASAATTVSNEQGEKPAAEKGKGVSPLSAALANKSTTAAPVELTRGKTATQSEPVKTVNTKHSGQQSLRIRSDGRVFATAGWDARVRVYSAKTLKEAAVLKWHQAGCFAVAFSQMEEGTGDQTGNDAGPGKEEPGQTGMEASLVPRLVELSVKDRRIRQAQTAHWLAAGSKDGKVSLWDVF